MTWILNDNSYMKYINNINQNPIILNDNSKCGICTGNILSNNPSVSPTPSPTSSFPYCNSTVMCKFQTYYSNTSFIDCSGVEGCRKSFFYLYEYATITCSGARSCTFSENCFFFLFVFKMK